MATVTLDVPGQVFENQYVEGNIYVAASGVTIRNCVINGRRNVLYGIEISVYARYTQIIDCDISGALNKGVVGAWMRVQNCDIHDIGEDGVFALGSYVEVVGCRIYGNGWKAGGHADGVQLMMGSHHRIRDNVFTLPHGVNELISNSCVYVEPNWTTLDDVIITNNLLDGGLYCCWVITGNFPNPTNVRVSGNALGRHYFGVALNLLPSVTAYNNINYFGRELRSQQEKLYRKATERDDTSLTIPEDLGTITPPTAQEITDYNAALTAAAVDVQAVPIDYENPTDPNG